MFSFFWQDSRPLDSIKNNILAELNKLVSQQEDNGHFCQLLQAAQIRNISQIDSKLKKFIEDFSNAKDQSRLKNVFIKLESLLLAINQLQYLDDKQAPAEYYEQIQIIRNCVTELDRLLYTNPCWGGWNQLGIYLGMLIGAVIAGGVGAGIGFVLGGVFGAFIGLFAGTLVAAVAGSAIGYKVTSKRNINACANEARENQKNNYFFTTVKIEQDTLPLLKLNGYILQALTYKEQLMLKAKQVGWVRRTLAEVRSTI